MSVADVIAWLERKGSKEKAASLARYALPTEGAFGVSVADLRDQAKLIGRNHDLALGLWDSGSWEARVLATLIDDPARVTPAQMEKWCKDFDSWGSVDSACFTRFDKSPHAWKKAPVWVKREREFEKRAGFVLMAGLARAMGWENRAARHHPALHRRQGQEEELTSGRRTSSGARSGVRSCSERTCRSSGAASSRSSASRRSDRTCEQTRSPSRRAVSASAGRASVRGG